MQAGRIARETARRLYGAGSAEDTAWMMFDGRSASLAGAAFALATQIDNLDGHDGYNPTKGHTGVAVVPALVGFGQHLPGLSGRDALAALVTGYEVAGRAATALHASVSDYHTSGAWNALGVVALGARLRGATAGQLREALGIAEYHGPRSQMMREIATPTMLHDGSGMGALVGVSALTMAELGFTGAPAVTVEAETAQPHWADLGEVWQVPLQYIKPYPICRWAHAAIDAVRELRLAHGIGADDVARVEIRTFHNAAQLFPGLPETTSQAQYSLPFAVAVMLVHGDIQLDHIAGAGLQDRRVAEVVGRTTVTVGAEHEARYPAGRWADVTLALRDGRRLQSVEVHARGGPERPFGTAEITGKFRRFAVPTIGAARADAIMKACLDLPRRGSTFADLLALLESPGG
ncbi:2-methylcitrate dehydratase [Sulfitobacter alexandrii]|uniref:2-methylcitrate dehydratase n=2 Tax=Sulfitobacter alexandrii TaxID=1917485 RepID=A0A1J0WMH5_9RHOB|nr:2-methylcitrate dehydratase [Sulfitobacter alexandrii]